MVRARPCDTERDDESTSDGVKDEDDGVPEYERQRLSRIRENRERLEALGLPILASNLLGSFKKQYKRKGKGKKSIDEEYQPSFDEDDGASTSSEEDNEEEDGKVGVDVPSGSSRASTRKGKSKGSLRTGKAKKTVTLQKHASESNYIDDDAAVQKAIALSLEGLTGVSDMERREGHIQDDGGKKKRRKKQTARVQMTEDEVILHFYQFDGKSISSFLLLFLLPIIMSQYGLGWVALSPSSAYLVGLSITWPHKLFFFFSRFWASWVTLSYLKCILTYDVYTVNTFHTLFNNPNLP
ncbi:uncharacterized protein LOC122073293 [Macadamia integrifolia]|uniref:uncharacterized protein LOC122073293 n=1 Tax=Macadamia integrifolia TaxID=60698 RepID=UPI001C4E63F3|nr:uncharacterized protein LOC122073293 [Macadamia integrifolia]